MVKKKHTTHGIATTDAKVPPPYKKATTDSGWKLQTIKRQHNTSTDSFIAETYGKGKSILVSNDKTAHKHNTEKGFIGYVYIDSTVSADEEDQYVTKYQHVMSGLRSSDLVDQRVYIPKHKTTYDTKKLPQVKRQKKSKNKQIF